MEGSLLARERKKRNYPVLASRCFSFLLERVETIRNRATYHRAVVPCQPSNRHLFTRACLSISVRTNIRSYVPTEVAYNASMIYRLQRSIYIYIYITGAYSYLLPHPWRTICAVLPYPLSALTKLTLSSFSRGRGLVANPDSNRDPREFPWSFTRCATIVPRSNFLSFFFPVVIAKFFFLLFPFLENLYLWKNVTIGVFDLTIWNRRLSTSGRFIPETGYDPSSEILITEKLHLHRYICELLYIITIKIVSSGESIIENIA